MLLDVNLDKSAYRGLSAHTRNGGQPVLILIRVQASTISLEPFRAY